MAEFWITNRGSSETRVVRLGFRLTRCSVLAMTRRNGGWIEASAGTAAKVSGELLQLIMCMLLGMWTFSARKVTTVFSVTTLLVYTIVLGGCVLELVNTCYMYRQLCLMAELLNWPYEALAMSWRACTRARNTVNTLVDLNDILPLVRQVVECMFRLVRRVMTSLTVVPLLTLITDAWKDCRCLLIRMTGAATAAWLSARVRLMFVVGMTTTLLIPWVISDLTCLLRARRLPLTLSSSRRSLTLTIGLSLLSSLVSKRLAVEGTISLTAPAVVLCSESVVQPIEQPSLLVVVWICCVTLLLPACPLESIWEIAVTEMRVTVVMPATESAVGRGCRLGLGVGLLPMGAALGPDVGTVLTMVDGRSPTGSVAPGTMVGGCYTSVTCAGVYSADGNMSMVVYVACVGGC